MRAPPLKTPCASPTLRERGSGPHSGGEPAGGGEGLAAAVPACPDHPRRTPRAHQGMLPAGGVEKRSIEARRRNEANDFLFHEAAEGDCGLVASTCRYGLIPDRQVCPNHAGRTHCGREMNEARITGPE